ncbi:DUF6445 family protein [Kordiimonas sp. SCSIO 12610]|uniref:DUF6445 family protein n=1 Tax=Kordiimonas sp. SCSIO 12610 TaxID=2829597 RepID=UPI00210958B2|nr:DUF6445 family protein [Kordiimonas sp. SCSIO 12610]UTW56569.1 hypothetical protein KFF44_06625 [Kordiimonas sp. SCSIO 12610]
MQRSFIIIDDFLKDPDQLRDIALGAEYSDFHPDAMYPGRNSVHPQIINGYTDAISKIVNEPLVPMEYQGTSNGKFRSTQAGQYGAARVHVDNCHWTAILFLSKPEHCEGGTNFFRHIPTGTEKAPLTANELGAYGVQNFNELWDDLIDAHTNDASKWEQTFSIPMKYNRLVLLRPWYWHDAGDGFGDCLENSRLIYMGFFNNPNGIPT